MKNSALLREQKRATVLFLYLFYIINLSYDLIYYHLFPLFMGQDPAMGVSEFRGYWAYAVQLALLPIAVYLLKKDKPQPVKYIYFITYTLTNLIREFFVYYDTDYVYNGGNIIEIIFVLFSPIFVNQRFFLLVSLGTIVKYSITGVIVQSPVDAAIPIIIVIGFSIVAFIVLKRFQRYINVVVDSYNQQFEGIVKGVIASLELKDPYTRGHSERVAEYSKIIAQKLGFSDNTLQIFYQACLLHDIGKVSIPESILMKNGPLTPEEYDVIKEHPTVGANVMNNLQGVQDIIDVILHHHERWDGNGYPAGLKGEKIPLLARIVCVADAFDAMTSARPYRSAMPVETAFKQIDEGSGHQFDPRIVYLFKDTFESWVKIHMTKQSG